ncbi:hypothetical protein [Alkalimonas mucilaginosa]|uniref:Transcription factor zinc-finger domain-containing protein n=1 Tax=Alkalimonas mucilaginosa TaxID=3057676 RepID=A0ABU7JD75_9GAMM|nr:hypothetical protein [Alkalimonas sp. MEB004]MEE2023604.1 hypothetical protein [Alkalimonas sp. MEB004]
MNTNSLNLVIDGYGFAILVADGSATLFDTLDDLKFHASVADIDLSEFECMWAYKLSPALLAKYGLECGSPTPEQPEGQPNLSTETVDNSDSPVCPLCESSNVTRHTQSGTPGFELHICLDCPHEWLVKVEPSA